MCAHLRAPCRWRSLLQRLGRGERSGEKLPVKMLEQEATDHVDSRRDHLAAIELYRTAFASAHYEGNLIWLVFSAMTVANGIILGTVGSLWPKGDDPLTQPTALLIIGASLLGWGMCRRWSLAMKRMWKFYGYWWAWAKKYEAMLDTSHQGPARSLEEFAQGGFPAIDTQPRGSDGKPSGYLDPVERDHRNGDFARLVPAWFAIAHAVMAAFAVAAWLC